jgi:hypothetical protein
MNPKTTLLLLFLVVALVAGIVGLERWLPTTRERLAAEADLLTFDEARLDHIEIGLAEGKSFVLVKQGQVWRVTEPFDDVADPERVARLLTELREMRLVERVQREEFDKTAWKATGLDAPVAKLRLMAGAERLVSFWLGQTGAMENTSYASMEAVEEGKERRVFVLRSGLHALLKEAPTLWRDLKLLRLPAEQVTRVTLSTADGEIEVAREPGEGAGWQLVKPLQTRGSKERIEERLAVLLNLDILSAEIAAVPGVPGTAPTGVAAEPDQVKVTVEAGGTSYELTLIKSAQAGVAEATAVAAHRRPHFKISAEQAALFWCQPNELRDEHLARVEAESVTEMGLRSSAFPEVELKQENQSWLLRRNGRWEPANGDRVARFFETLNQTKVREFTSDSAAELTPYGLDTPFLTLWWQVAGAAARTELLFGQSADQKGFYVKDGKEPFIYRISADVLPQFPPDALKWKGRGVLRFSMFDLKKITLAIGAAPAVELSYNPVSAEWTGKAGDQVVTPMIDRVKADSFAGALGRLSADDWSSALGVALKALEKPTVRIQVNLQSAGQADAPMRTHDLKFAPTQEGQDTAIYYGRLDEQPDVFYLSRESLRGLLKPVFKDGAARR